jgi:hypothetical protein
LALSIGGVNDHSSLIDTVGFLTDGSIESESKLNITFSADRGWAVHHASLASKWTCLTDRALHKRCSHSGWNSHVHCPMRTSLDTLVPIKMEIDHTLLAKDSSCCIHFHDVAIHWLSYAEVGLEHLITWEPFVGHVRSLLSQGNNAIELG